MKKKCIWIFSIQCIENEFLLGLELYDKLKLAGYLVLNHNLQPCITLSIRRRTKKFEGDKEMRVNINKTSE